MDSQFIILKNKLDSFVRRYYINLIIKGLIIFPTLSISIIVIVSLLEYIGWFNISIRFFIFLFTLSSFLFFFVYFLFFPLLKFLGIGKTISNKNASKIISEYFPELKDYIINILELNELKDNDLVISSINQKIDGIKNYNFNQSINFLNNLKLGRYLIVSSIILISTLVFKPQIYTEATKRIINYNVIYEKDAGFNILINQELLNIEKGKDINLVIDVSGDELPNELFIRYGGSNYLLNKVSDKNFKYKFRNVNNNFSFTVLNTYFESKPFYVTVNNSPILKNYKIEVIPPKYISAQNKIYENINEISVPIGSQVNFTFNSLYTDKISIQKNEVDSTIISSSKTFKYSYLVKNYTKFSIGLFNEFTSFESIININVKVIPDLFPSIKVNYVNDKENFRVFYFKGLIEDDYGFSKLQFFNPATNSFNDLQIQKSVKTQEFYFAYEFSLDYDFQEIYFIVCDNDKPAGYKSTKSELISIEIPSVEQLAEKNNENYESLNNKLDKSLLLASELRRDIEEIKKSLINENLEVWEKQSKLKSLEKKNKQLEDIIKNIANENLEKDNYNNSFSDEAKQLAEKQKQIQELLDNVMTDELKKLMDEINKLSNDFDENKLQELTKDLELNYKELSDQLDKNLELLKRFEIEEKLNQAIQRLNELKEEQKEITDKLSGNEEKLGNVNSDIEDINNKLNNINKDYNDILEKNNELKKSLKLDSLSNEFKNLNDQLENLSEELDDNYKSDKEKSIKIEQDLKNLADNMQEMLDSNNSNQEGEDAELLRQILENLFIFSFKQEEIYDQLKYISQENPKYAELKISQNKLSDDYKIIRDSLYALGSRSSHIGSHIINSAFNIESKLLDINQDILENRIGIVNRKQRELLTNINDMILLLSESLKNMDNNMGSGGKSGNKKKKKPQKGQEPSLSDLQKGQESLKEQLQQMLNEMKGNNGKMSKSGLEKMGKSLAQQEIMQQMLNEMLNNGGVGKDATKKLEEIKRLMEANKRDIVNMNINDRIINRQKQIMTRLLEAETAEMERDKDDKRESKQAFNYNRSNPEKLFDDSNENINFNEIFNTKSINLFDFYKYKYQEYLIKVNNLTDEKRN